MSVLCKAVEEAIASGEELSAETSEHIAGCTSCEEMRALSLSLSSTLATVSESPMPLGLYPRLRTSVLARGPSHQRRFIALGACALAAVALFLVFRSAGPEGEATRSTAQVPDNLKEVEAQTPASIRPVIPETQLLQVALLADVEQSLHASADWDLYLEPIAASELLAEEIER